jgi:hypothetical protein
MSSWLRLNSTGGYEQISSGSGFYVPVSDYLALAFLTFFVTFTLLFLFLVWIRADKLLDRYRLKYSFDREIERKECSKEDTEEKLNKRERLFKRRTFKD